MARTKKVGPAGRLGSRYGTKVRGLVAEIERKLRQPQACPSCGAPRLKRIGTSIWHCARCDAKFAGGAYSPPRARPVGEGG